MAVAYKNDAFGSAEATMKVADPVVISTLEAQQAGFAVNKPVLDKVLKYLAFRLKKRETEPYQYFDIHNLARQKVIAKKEIAHSLYVLLTLGKIARQTPPAPPPLRS